MTSIALVCASVLIIFGLCQGVTARKPTIISTKDELVVQEGDELRVQCQGEGGLRFSAQENIAMPNHPGFTASKDGDGTYTFIRSNSTKEDAGWYVCINEGVEIGNDDKMIDLESENIAWVYVYVNCTSPFVSDATDEFISAVAGGRLIVPCRSTSPDLTVKLEINWGMTEVPDDVTYDSKIGFIIENVCVDMSRQTFECVLDGPQSTDTPTWPSYSAYVADSALLEKPRINENSVRHVVRGKDLAVACEIDVVMAKKFDMTWRVPESVAKERWSFDPEPKAIGNAGNGLLTWSTELTVKNFEASDEGEYHCAVTALSDRVEASVDIKSWDPNYTYINVAVDGSNEITALTREEAQWKIKIDAYPEIVVWKWYRADGSEITIDLDEHSKKYSHVEEGSNVHFFGIRQLTKEDSGNYTIKFSNSINETSIFLPLTILAR